MQMQLQELNQLSPCQLIRAQRPDHLIRIVGAEEEICVFFASSELGNAVKKQISSSQKLNLGTFSNSSNAMTSQTRH